ncbi:hypothetical protein [Enhygromyxa salina]|uniref:Uncharacterized protein n=1 Tax=Enhygromyxa salina TaxID=215803 RepID=A0A2S9XLA7_9BACT|nr:hypothetical protein [Enhygromyxa salina]PRP93659.1 hypothetical protein ENSA7_80870 [Enhygromyxa salina]
MGWSPRSAATALGLLGLACADDGPVAQTSTSTDSGSESAGSETFATATSTSESESDSGTDEAEPIPEQIERSVLVLLDGVPLQGAIVIQGGTGVVVHTDADGRALALIDTTIQGALVLMASDERARTKASEILVNDASEIVFELESIEPGDNEAYEFNPAGVPENPGTTAECGHCHQAFKDQWFGSPHRRSASNPVVQDIYAGVATALADQATCEAAGGQWWVGVVPGSDQLAPRCYIGTGALPDLNEACGDLAACDGVATSFGACADCHAPAIDGVVGGRDLHDAIGASFEGGVHCDLCHKVESIDLDGPAGVAGRLRLHRPVEPSPSPSVGPWKPLAFGPYADVPNPRMGASPRQHFLTAEFCSGCHQHDQAALVPGASLDLARWPDGVFPAHSTYEEWRAGPFFEIAPCSSCHMPADPTLGNGADLTADKLPMQGVALGWLRPPGATREHTWVGPRTPASGMLQLAAAIFIDKAVADGTLTTQITVRNAGAGHAIPTGEPLRSLVLFVQARCDGEVLTAIDGDVIPEFGGWLDRKPGPEDWSVWPGAAIGDVVRVVTEDGWVDYEGFGPFGDGSFDVTQKGLPRLRVVGQSRVISVNGDQVSFDVPLPVGDVAYRGRDGYFEAGEPLAAAAVAGAPGFGFARVLADENGMTMVPHHRAVDVVSDNRILPQQEWTSTHVFAASCVDPVVDAVLLHRPYPVALARERGWDDAQQIMVEVSK